LDVACKASLRAEKKGVPKRICKSIRKFIVNLRNPSRRVKYNKDRKEAIEAIVAKAETSPDDLATEESAKLTADKKRIMTNKNAIAVLSDIRAKRDSGKPLLAGEQDALDLKKKQDKKSFAKRFPRRELPLACRIMRQKSSYRMPTLLPIALSLNIWIMRMTCSLSPRSRSTRIANLLTQRASTSRPATHATLFLFEGERGWTLRLVEEDTP